MYCPQPVWRREIMAAGVAPLTSESTMFRQFIAAIIAAVVSLTALIFFVWRVRRSGPSEVPERSSVDRHGRRRRRPEDDDAITGSWTLCVRLAQRLQLSTTGLCVNKKQTFVMHSGGTAHVTWWWRHYLVTSSLNYTLCVSLLLLGEVQNVCQYVKCTCLFFS